MLIGREALHHLIAHGLDPHPLDERLDDAEVHVGFEQRQPDFTQCRVDRGFGEANLATKRLEDVLQTRAERFEHVR